MNEPGDALQYRSTFQLNTQLHSYFREILEIYNPFVTKYRALKNVEKYQEEYFF